MSGSLGVLGQLQSSVMLLPSPTALQRKIGEIIPDCVIEERHVDRLEVTQHPVEKGAKISDHAYLMPLQVTLRYGFSNSSPRNSMSQGDLSILTGGAILDPFTTRIGGQEVSGGFLSGGEEYIKQQYENLIDLQESLTPFDIITGKRSYKNMLLLEMETSSDANNEYSLIVELTCQQVIIVSTSAVSNASTDPTTQSNPEQTTGTLDRGSQQLTSATPPVVPDTPSTSPLGVF